MRWWLRPVYVVAGLVAEAAATLAAPGGGKLRRSFNGRRGVAQRFVSWAAKSRDPTRPLVWVHAPSVGEGLQARPVLDALRSRRPDLQLAFTFFSPSARSFAAGLDVDFSDLLPFDTAASATATLDALRPTALVFSKLDVWPILVDEAKRRDIPVALISATLAPTSSRNGAFAALLLGDTYAQLDAVGAISASDAERLVRLGCRPNVVHVTGDTRFDQVIERARQVNDNSPLLAGLRANRPTLVAGSTWPADERELLTAIADARTRQTALRVIIAPHEPTAAHVASIVRWAAAAGFRSATIGDAAASAADVVIVDRIGVLGDLYALADIAFVGGGFHSAGLHSVLEPAAFGVPVIFGPRHDGSRDAGLLLEKHAARAADDSEAIVLALRTWLDDPAARRAAGDAALRVVSENAGATERSVALIETLIAGRRGPAPER